jgi:predicted DNA-binding antitoxin AbrB/MazE fold protein
MTRQLEAIYDEGVFRPLEPLALANRQRVLLTVRDVPDDRENGYIDHRHEETEWLRAHRAEYAGKWVALQGSELICSGIGAKEVRDEARAKGIAQPLVVRVPEEPDNLSAGW